jgi:sec-independent protein translocase protein TatA
MMGDVAKGIKEFKKGMAEDDDATTPPSQIPGPAPTVVDAETKSEKHS